MTRRAALSLSLCAVALASAACAGARSADTAAGQGRPEAEMSINKTVEVETQLVEKPPAAWKADAFKTGGRENLELVRFLDPARGWAAGGGALYETSDGGRSWRRVSIEVPAGAEFADIFFLDSSHGWAALQRRASDVTSYEENHLWLMRTSDGGRSWRASYEARDAVVTRVAFADERHGWLTGVRYFGRRPVTSALLLLNTSDGGQTWADVSEGASRLVTNEQGFVEGWVTDILTDGPLGATALALRGRLLKTTDGGRSWQEAGRIEDEPKHTCLCRLGRRADGSLWAAGGADSQEGMWGMLASARGDTWQRRRLAGFFLSDALFLSGERVLAAGSLPRGRDGLRTGRREGALLYSSDGGGSWAVVYRDARLENLNALTTAGPGLVWASGPDGTLLRVEARP